MVYKRQQANFQEIVWNRNEKKPFNILISQEIACTFAIRAPVSVRLV